MIDTLAAVGAVLDGFARNMAELRHNHVVRDDGLLTEEDRAAVFSLRVPSP